MSYVVNTKDDWPLPTQTVVVRTSVIFAGLHSVVKSRIDRDRIEITTPYDVTGDPFYVPIGDTVILEWDQNATACQKEFLIEDYHEVTDFLRDERKLPTVILTTMAMAAHHYKIERQFFRTAVHLPLAMRIEDKKLDVIIADVSGGGIAFLHERPIRINQRIEAAISTFDMKGKIQQIPISGRTVNLNMIHPRQYRIGVQFDYIRESERDKLIMFVNGCTGKKRSGNCKSCILRKEKDCMVKEL